MSSLLIDPLIGSLPEAQFECFLLLLDGLISLSLVDPDEIVLNLLVAPAEHPSQVLLETKHFRGVSLNEFVRVKSFLLVYITIRIVESVLTLAEVD